MASADQTHLQKACKKKLLLCHLQDQHQESLLQHSPKTLHQLCICSVSHWLCITSVGWPWQSTLELYIEGQANWSFLFRRAKDECTWNFKTYCNSSLTIKEYLCVKFWILPQTTWHNTSLVTSPTTLTPGITSVCQGQGLTSLKLAYPSLEHPSGTPCLKV